MNTAEMTTEAGRLTSATSTRSAASDARPGYVIEVTILSIFEVLVLVLSTSLIALIWCRPQLRRNYTNWLVSNACAVVLAGAVFYRWAYIVTASEGGVWPLGVGCCHLMWFSHSVLRFCQPASLFLVSTVCCIFVYDPMTFSRKVTRNTILALIGLSWLAAVVYAALRTYAGGWPVLTSDRRQDDDFCYHVTYRRGEQLLLPTVGIVFEHVVAFGALVLVTLLVLVFSCRLHHGAPKGGDPELVDERQRQAKQAAVLVSASNGVYLLLSLPLFVAAVRVSEGSLVADSPTARVAYVVHAAYDVVQLVLWGVLIPDVADGVKSLCESCSSEGSERTRLL